MPLREVPLPVVGVCLREITASPTSWAAWLRLLGELETLFPRSDALLLYVALLRLLLGEREE